MPRWRSGRLSGYGDWTGRRWAGWRGSEAGFGDDAEAKKSGFGGVRQSRPLSAVADAKRT